MNLLKTPHQLLLEEAGAIPASPGLLHTPKQMLMQEAGVTPKFAAGGHISVNDMLAEIMAANQTPQKFAQGGSTMKNIGIQSALSLPFMAEDAQLIANDIKEKRYPEAAARTAGVGYSAFTPFNPLTALISGLTYSSETGDATLDAFLAKKEEMARMQEAAKNQKPPRQREQHNVIPITETRFYKK